LESIILVVCPAVLAIYQLASSSPSTGAWLNLILVFKGILIVRTTNMIRENYLSASRPTGEDWTRPRLCTWPRHNSEHQHDPQNLQQSLLPLRNVADIRTQIIPNQDMKQEEEDEGDELAPMDETLSEKDVETAFTSKFIAEAGEGLIWICSSSKPLTLCIARDLHRCNLADLRRRAGNKLEGRLQG
jgi:hypothetical protein